MLGNAPDFAGTQTWFNTAGGQPLTLAKLRGHPVLVDFWTYTCINCIRTFPYLKAWDRRYRKAGLVIVGVHTPEFPFERDESNVRDAIAQNEPPLSRRPGQRARGLGRVPEPVLAGVVFPRWPGPRALRPLRRGRLRREGGRDPRAAQGGGTAAGSASGRAWAGGVRPGSRLRRPIWAPRGRSGSPTVRIRPGTQEYEQPSELRHDQLGYGGRWLIGDESATALANARVELDFGARRVYLVLGSRGRVPRTVHVLIDGRPISARLAGRDVHAGRVSVERQRLYELVDLPRAERHRLTLNLDEGVSGYAFTFG